MHTRCMQSIFCHCVNDSLHCISQHTRHRESCRCIHHSLFSSLSCAVVFFLCCSSCCFLFDARFGFCFCVCLLFQSLLYIKGSVDQLSIYGELVNTSSLWARRFLRSTCSHLGYGKMSVALTRATGGEHIVADVGADAGSTFSTGSCNSLVTDVWHNDVSVSASNNVENKSVGVHSITVNATNEWKSFRCCGWLPLCLTH